MRVLKALPYIFCVFCSMGMVAFSTASLVVLSDIAKERVIIAATIDAPLEVISNIDWRGV